MLFNVAVAQRFTSVCWGFIRAQKAGRDREKERWDEIRVKHTHQGQPAE